MKHGKFEYAGYTGVYNLLDYSAVSFPCGIQADEKIDVAYSGHHPLSEFDVAVQGSCESCCSIALCAIALWAILADDSILDDATLVHEMPVSLQLVGRRLEEEKILMMTETVLQSL